jgi:hypothetical protein
MAYFIKTGCRLLLKPPSIFLFKKDFQFLETSIPSNVGILG